MSERMPRRLDANGLWEYALRALGARASSTAELREKLLRRAARSDDVDPVLARLKDSGFLNDRRFAESYSNSRLENEGFGRRRVLDDLRRRRVARPVAEKAVDQAYAGADEMRLIEEYLGRKYRSVSLQDYLSDPKNLAAAYRRLRSAGFTAANVMRVLKRFASEPEWLDSLDAAEPENPED